MQADNKCILPTIACYDENSQRHTAWLYKMIGSLCLLTFLVNHRDLGCRVLTRMLVLVLPRLEVLPIRLQLCTTFRSRLETSSSTPPRPARAVSQLPEQALGFFSLFLRAFQAAEAV